MLNFAEQTGSGAVMLVWSYPRTRIEHKHINGWPTWSQKVARHYTFFTPPFGKTCLLHLQVPPQMIFPAIVFFWRPHSHTSKIPLFWTTHIHIATTAIVLQQSITPLPTPFFCMHFLLIYLETLFFCVCVDCGDSDHKTHLVFLVLVLLVVVVHACVCVC